MKKKIGIITFFRGNYGSILQCYATCKVLQKHGFSPYVIEKEENRIINVLRFGCRCIRHPQDITTFLHIRKMQNLGGVQLSEVDKQYMNNFIERELPVLTLKAFQLRKLGHDEDYVAFLSGSDQIWGGYTYIVDSTRFLRFAPKFKRIAWAPSFGTSNIARYNKKKYKKYISQYNSLSVRELSAVEIVRELTGIIPVALNDPVFLLTQEEWKSISENVFMNKYVLYYFLDSISDKTIEQISSYCKKNNTKLIVFGPCNYEKLKINFEKVDGGPEIFVGLIANAQCVFTDSFHAVSFSIIMKKPFFVYKRNYTHGIDQSSRIQTLLEKMHMQWCFEPKNILEFKHNFSYSDTVILNEKFVMTKYLLDSIKLCTLEEQSNEKK